MRGGVEWQIQHKPKLSAVFDTKPIQSTVFFHTSQGNGVLTDLLFCIERISSSRSNGSEMSCV